MNNLSGTYITYDNTLNPVITGSQNVTISNNSGSYLIDVDRSFIEYIDFAFQIMGIDLTYENFKKMSDDEKKAFLRNIKLNRIL